MTIIDNRTPNFDLARPHPDNLLADDVLRLDQSLQSIDTKAAPLASPTFTGDPKAPTPTVGDNDTSIATTAFVKTAIANLVASSPAALDTLNELSAALGNDPSFATTMTNALAAKAPLASPALTGNPTAPTPSAGDNDTSIATTAFVGASGLGLGASPSTTDCNLFVTNGWAEVSSTTANTPVAGLVGVLRCDVRTSGRANQTVYLADGGGGVRCWLRSQFGPTSWNSWQEFFTTGNQIALGTTASSARSAIGAAPIDTPTFTGDPKAPTPAKGDNDTSVATTAFVKAEGMQYSAIYAFSTAQTLTAAHLGSVIFLRAPGGFNINLFSPASAYESKTITFINTSAAAVTVTTPTGVISGAYPLADAAALVLNVGDKVELTCETSAWYISSWHQRNNVEFFAASLLGDSTAVTQASADNTNKISTTAFVKTAIANLVASSPAALDTLNELATALGNDPNFATTMTSALAAKAPLASPALTGNPTAPTATAGDNDTSIATTAFVQTAVAAKAPLASPAFTGIPTVPSPFSVSQSDTQIATTGFVQSVVSNALASPVFTGNPTAPTPSVGDNDTSLATTAFVNANALTKNATKTTVWTGSSTASVSIASFGFGLYLAYDSAFGACALIAHTGVASVVLYRMDIGPLVIYRCYCSAAGDIQLSGRDTTNNGLVNVTMTAIYKIG